MPIAPNQVRYILVGPLDVGAGVVEGADVGIREELGHARPHLSDGGEEALVHSDGEVETERRAHVVGRGGTTAAATVALGSDDHRCGSRAATLALPPATEARAHEPGWG